MKKIITILAALTFSFGMAAQEDKSENPVLQDVTNQGNKTNKGNMHQGENMHQIKMVDDKMMMMKDGKWMIMEHDMTMHNGSVISSTGVVTMKDGKTRQMKNGDKMDGQGIITEKQK